MDIALFTIGLVALGFLWLISVTWDIRHIRKNTLAAAEEARNARIAAERRDNQK